MRWKEHYTLDMLKQLHLLCRYLLGDPHHANKNSLGCDKAGPVIVQSLVKNLHRLSMFTTLENKTESNVDRSY